MRRKIILRRRDEIPRVVLSGCCWAIEHIFALLLFHISSIIMLLTKAKTIEVILISLLK